MIPTSPESTPRAELGRVAVLGLGLMGGSLVRALREAAQEGRAGLDALVGWSPRSEERRAAEAACGMDTADAPGEAVRGATLVVLAAPLSAVRSLARELAGTLDPAATLTDVASLKVPVRDAVEAAGLAGRWVGAHPMAGSEASGFEASRRDLYHGATVWLTPHRAAVLHRTRVEALWHAVGAHTVPTDPEGHDALMARVSHLPQLLANALAATLQEEGVSADHLGPGGRDMTRLAGSSPEVWRDILAAAPPELGRALETLSRRIGELAHRVDRGDVDALIRLMDRTRRWRVGG